MKVNFDNIIGTIKPMHAMNGAPLMACQTTLFEHYKEAGIPYSRLHDLGTDGMRPMVDIHCVFPRFEADETLPESYDFTYTDNLITGLVENGCKPYYRLGETIENDIRKGFAPRNVKPPLDYDKWARICEHIVRHYNEGWADGFHYGIEYWEIWNEPENGVPGAVVRRANQCWTGTKEQFYELYAVTAKHLKECFGDSIKVGGYGCCTMYGFFEGEELPERAAGAAEYRMEFFHGFMKYITEKKVPLDFFSFHTYWDIAHNVRMPAMFRKALEPYGLSDIEIHLNEWNPVHTYEDFGSSYMIVQYAAMMLVMQNLPVEMMCFYRGEKKITTYASLFDVYTGEPTNAFYAFKAFGKLYELGQQAECDTDEDDIYAVAATNGERFGVLIANTGETARLKTNLDGFTAYIIDSNNCLEQTELDSKEFDIQKDQVIYFEK